MILLIILLAMGVVYAILYILAPYHPYNEFFLTVTRPSRAFFMAWRYKNSLFSAWRMETILDQHRRAAHEDVESVRQLLASVTRSVEEIMQGPAYPINDEYCWMHSGP
ncbi:MAG TPA: hypothetical protein VGN34_27630, partial [Ktedonobacteraceae bacterium]